METQRPHRLRSCLCSIFVSVFVPLALGGLPRSAAAQPAGYVFVAGNQEVSIIDTATQSLFGTVAGNVNNDAAASRDGRRVYVTTGNAMRVIDVATKQVVAVVAPTSPSPVNAQTGGIALTPDETTAWVANVGTNNVGVIDLATNTVVATVPVGFVTLDVAITPDGQHALVVGTAPTVAVIDVATRTVTQTITLTGNAYGVAVHPGGHTAYVALRTAEAVSVVDLDAGSESTTIPLAADPTDLVVSPNGSTLYVSVQQPHGLRVISTTTHAVTGTLAGGAGGGILGYSVALTPDGSKLYFGGLNNVGSVAFIDPTGPTFVSDINVSPYPFGLAAGPPIIRGDCCGDTTIANDAALTALHFGDHVPFFQGTLSLSGNLTTSRTISLLSDGATRTDGVIDTGTSHEATLNGPVIGEGTLVKRGFGILRLAGDATHAGGTRVEAGSLVVTGHHAGAVALMSPLSSIEGTGAVGPIQAPTGSINLYAGALHAGQVTLGPDTQVVTIINGVSGTHRLAVTGSAALNNAKLTIFYLQGVASLAPGQSATLVERATGEFFEKPEGWTTVAHDGQLLRLTYRGGSSGSDVVLMAETGPTLAPLIDRTIVQNTALGPLTLDVADSFTSPGMLTITATSSNQALVPNTQMQIGNSGGVRTLTVTPLFDATGETTITVTVTDEAALQVQRTFVLTVLPTRSYYLAEGATGGFFSTDILLANPNITPAPIDITFSKDDGGTITRQMTLPATSRTTIRANELEGLEAAAFSTTVVSTDGLPLVVERTMWWDASGYGASTEKAGTEGATTWYFAEGSQGYFHTYFLLFNPNITATVAHVTYLLEDGATIQRDHPVPAATRVTIDAGDQPELIDRSFGARIVFDQPALAERAMYFGDTPLYGGGAAVAGVNTPGTTWYLAEGATGSFFDTYVLIANPNDELANLTVTYLPDAGAPIAKSHTLAAHQRLTLNIAEEDPALQHAAVSTHVDADRPVVVERSQYWPHGGWYESHASAGETAPGVRWGLAEGRVGGASDARTFILIANPGASAAEITATFLRSDGTTLIKTFTVQPTSRFTIGVSGDAAGPVPELVNESFATIITSTEPVIVERSLYTSVNGVTWTAGTNTTATRLP